MVFRDHVLSVSADFHSTYRPFAHSPFNHSTIPPFHYRKWVSVHVTSEIGALQAVIVHSPGGELDAVTPGNRQEYLYDDVVEGERARREHQRFVAILERFATVHQVRDLLAEIVDDEQARQLIINETMDIVPSEPLAREIAQLDAASLVKMMIEGREERRGPLATALNRDAYLLPPLPNLFFTRDSGIVTGEHVL